MQIIFEGPYGKMAGIKVESGDTIESIAAHTHFTTSELVDIIQDIVDNDEELAHRRTEFEKRKLNNEN
jgi:LysM repeat protein